MIHQNSKFSYDIEFFIFKFFNNKILSSVLNHAEEDHDFDLRDGTWTHRLRLCSHLDSWIVKKFTIMKKV